MPRKRTTNIKGRGGARPGAGRKKGSVKKFDAEVRKRAAEEGILPLDYMLRVMRDARVPKARRDMMASAAAPYLHAKLSSVEVKNPKGEAFRTATKDMSLKEATDAFSSTFSQPAYEDVEQTETKH
jgi:hypothetical protein